VGAGTGGFEPKGLRPPPGLRQCVQPRTEFMGLDEIGTARTLREHRKVTDAPRGETRQSAREDHG
jgi:hypothetical protein